MEVKLGHSIPLANADLYPFPTFPGSIQESLEPELILPDSDTESQAVGNVPYFPTCIYHPLPDQLFSVLRLNRRSNVVWTDLASRHCACTSALTAWVRSRPGFDS